MAKKRKTTAQTLRAKERHRQRAAGDGGPGPAGGNGASSRGARTAKRRPAARSKQGSTRWVSWAAIGGVVVLVAALVVVFATRNPPGPGAKGSAAAIAKATSVPASTLEQIGVPSGTRAPSTLPPGTPPVTTDGKPVITYVGAEYCPFCAAERWPMVVALSRFGTFSNLGTTTSAPPPEVYPNTPTFSFHGSSLASDHLVFSSVETATRDRTPLDTPTAQQEQLLRTYNTTRYVGSDGSIPFVMIGNRYAWVGASYDLSVLNGLSFDEIANQLNDPNSEVAKAIDGAANQITAMICQTTGNQPSAVCSAPYIQQAQANLGR